MSKNVILNGQTYNGVSEVSLPVSGGTANFKDEDEIPAAPSGTKIITENGDGIDVAAFEKVNVNVSGGGLPLPTYATSRTITVEATVGDNSGGALSACNALNLAAHEVAYLIDEQTAEAQLLYIFAETTSKYHAMRYRNSAVQYTSVSSDASAGGIVAGTKYVVFTWA